MSSKISIIVPCYWVNDELIEITNRCLSGLIGAGLNELIVVDDGSPIQYDESKYNFKNAHLIRMPENQGYASAVNVGLDGASGDYLIICNNDIEFVQHDWLKHLLKPLNEGYDISSIRVTDADGWITDDYISEGDKFGSIWCMKRKVYEVLGGLSEDYGKGYFEDLDYHRRAEDAGFKVGKNHAGLVDHIGKATFKITDPKDTSYHESMGKYIQKWGKHRL